MSQKIFNLINVNEPEELKIHLEKTKDLIEVTSIMNSSGFSAVHAASYKSQVQTCEVLLNFVLGNQAQDETQFAAECAAINDENQ